MAVVSSVGNYEHPAYKTRIITLSVWAVSFSWRLREYSWRRKLRVFLNENDEWQSRMAGAA